MFARLKAISLEELLRTSPEQLRSGEIHVQEGSEGNFWVNVTVALFCTIVSGFMSGLTVGLASIDRLALEVDAMGDK